MNQTRRPPFPPCPASSRQVAANCPSGPAWHGFPARVILVAGALLVVSLACAKTDPVGAPATSAATVGTTAPTASEIGATVTIKDFAFGPKNVTVKAGQTVQFKNADSAPHEPSEGAPGKTRPVFDVATAAGETDKTPPLPKGTYAYYCALHEYMKGEITVE